MRSPTLLEGPALAIGQDSVFAVAIGWVVGLLSSEVSTILAVIAVAIFGMLVILGRGDVRSGGRVAVGCFIVFGAATIAQGLLGVIGQEREVVPLPEVGSPAPPERIFKPETRPANPFDPYSGESPAND